MVKENNEIDEELDRRLFQLNDDDFNAFQAALDQPLLNPAKLKDLLNEKSPWE